MKMEKQKAYEVLSSTQKTFSLAEKKIKIKKYLE